MESGNKNTLTGLAARLGKMPPDKRRAALEVSAALAGVSLKVSREFVEAVPRAARTLSAEDLRAWGELGRRLAMGSADTGVKFFASGVRGLRRMPESSRGLLFQICTRQLVLSSSIALETFNFAPTLAAEIGDPDVLRSLLDLALNISHRSAKHSSEFLQRTPPLAKVVREYGDDARDVANGAIELASVFATRTGGMTADLWASLPHAFEGLSAAAAIRLAESSVQMMDHGGSVTLHFVSAGSDVLRTAASVFDEWVRVLDKVGKHGNAVLIAFLRATPKFFAQIAQFRSAVVRTEADRVAAIKRVLELTGQIAEVDAESALAAFRSSTAALRKVTLEQFEEWIETGLSEMADESTKARRSYFALETRQSREHLSETRTGLPLDKIQAVLRIYIEGLTGKEVEIAPLSAIPQESRIGDGKTIYLPTTIAEFEDEEKDFRLYKVLAAHGAGQIEFGTFAKDTVELKAAFTDLALLYEASADDTDMFSLGGYLADIRSAERGLTDEEIRAEIKRRKKGLPKDSDYREVLKLFPEPRLARKIFGTMENARIDSCLRHTYRGLRKDLDLMRRFLAEKRPYIFDVPIHQVPFELLFQITMCGGATDDARQFYSQIVSEIETIVEKYFVRTRSGSDGVSSRSGNDPVAIASGSDSSVADSLLATSRVYSLFQNLTPEQLQEAEPQEEDKGEFIYEDKESSEAVTEDKIKQEPQNQKPEDVKDLFDAWNSIEEEGEPDDLQGSEAWTHNEMPEQALEPGDEAFAYDEWDRDLNDYRVGWSRVIEKKVKQGDRTFVELARTRYKGVISSIRHQFKLMKPENLTRVNREIDGEDYDLNALVEYVVDRRSSAEPSENIYTKRLRKQRDVAVSLLLDQSSSTARTITRNPLQPYTYPGRRIIEIEKEGLVLMSEALEAVGDVYAINGFTSEGRRNVKFYVVKDFHEKYSDETERRIGGITFQNNTRLGAAIRHAAHKLLKQESRTKLLIILTDGRPYDHDYGDARYAREDVREALIEAKSHGITPFCITIDRESESELRDLYGDVGYTIIDDVLSLPERLPNIYRRLTT